MRPSIRLTIAIVAGAVAGGLLFVASLSFMTGLVWECIHRNPGDRFYCGETMLRILPALIVAACLLIAIVMFRWVNGRLKR